MNNQEQNQNFKCLICGNTDIYSIGYLNGKPYCRRCISFRGEEVEHEIPSLKKAPFHIAYELSLEQKKLSNKLVNNYKKGINSLVFAVTGSGKTEIVFNIIKYAIEHKKKVGFACARRDVVVELYKRFANVFSKNKITAVYGGHLDDLSGDLICLTTHQLFRYQNYFDLLIMDEIDAFPYKNNPVLESMFYRAVKGNYILLSATPSEEFIKEFSRKGGDVLKLTTRFHGHPLPVPELKTGGKVKLICLLIKYIKEFSKNNKPVFVFTPTIDMCENIFNLIHLFIRDGNYVHSKHPNRSSIIERFREGKYKYLITTAVLERGVTIKNAQVIIYRADHSIYDRYSLVQIAGRVGRKKEAPEGRVIYLANRNNNEIQESIKNIESANKTLQNLL